MACPMLLGLYAKASRRRHVRGHDIGFRHISCARLLRHDVEEGFAERAVRLLSHGCRSLCAGLLPEEKVCAQRLPAHDGAGQHQAVLVSAISAAIVWARLL